MKKENQAARSPPEPDGLPFSMDKPPVRRFPAPIPRKVAIGLIVGWMVIAIKCAFIPYLMARWRAPVDPGWVIVPTLIFALLVSLLVISHDWSQPED